jgi:heme-degrading monooxygenase HmoA
MVIVHVKHYLNDAGISFFLQTWFNDGGQLLQQQEGFRSLKCSRDKDDPNCMNLWVEFENEETLTKWGRSQLHDQFVGRLDCYRPKPYEAKRYVIERYFERK